MRTTTVFRAAMIAATQVVLSIAVLTQTTVAGIIVTTQARDAVGNILVDRVDVDATSATTGFTIVDPGNGNSYSGFAAGHATTVSGFNTLKFQLLTDAIVPANGHIETQSKVTWNDTISNGVAGSAANLQRP